MPTPDELRALAERANNYHDARAPVPPSITRPLADAVLELLQENERLRSENQRTHEALSRMTQVVTGESP